MDESVFISTVLCSIVLTVMSTYRSAMCIINIIIMYHNVFAVT